MAWKFSNFIFNGIQEFFFLSGEFNNTWIKFYGILNIQEKGFEFRFRNHSWVYYTGYPGLRYDYTKG